MFIDGLNEPMIHARIVEPNLDFEPLLIEDASENFEEGMPNEEGNKPDEGRVQEEDLTGEEVPDRITPDNEDANLIPEEPQNPGPEDLRRRGIMRERSEEQSEENGLDFPQMKRRRTMELPDDSEEEWKPSYPQRLPGRRWPDKGPSNHQTDIWEE